MTSAAIRPIHSISSISQTMVVVMSLILLLLVGQAPRSSLAFSPSIIGTVTTDAPCYAKSSTITMATRRGCDHLLLSQHSTISSLSRLNHHQDKVFSSSYSSTTSTSLQMLSDQNNESNSSSSLPVFLDPGTKGGVVVLSILLFLVPILIYQIATGPMGLDEVTVGRDIGVGFSVVTMLLWGSTYIFRVATKDMTYAKQLKDYEAPPVDYCVLLSAAEVASVAIVIVSCHLPLQTTRSDLKTFAPHVAPLRGNLCRQIIFRTRTWEHFTANPMNRPRCSPTMHRGRLLPITTP